MLFTCLCGVNSLCSHIAGMRGIWSLKATSMDAFDTFLVLTFVGETRVLAINSEDELDEAEIEGFDSEAQVSSCRFDWCRCTQAHYVDHKSTLAQDGTVMVVMVCCLCGTGR